MPTWVLLLSVIVGILLLLILILILYKFGFFKRRRPGDAAAAAAAAEAEGLLRPQMTLMQRPQSQLRPHPPPTDRKDLKSVIGPGDEIL